METCDLPYSGYIQDLLLVLCYSVLIFYLVLIIMGSLPQ
jgi:hypothetical protein